MNTTINTKGKAHGFGKTASKLAVVALIAVIGILVVAFYISASQVTGPADANNPVVEKHFPGKEKDDLGIGIAPPLQASEQTSVSASKSDLSDWYARHPELQPRGTDLSDYAQRHPGAINAVMTSDQSDWYLRHREVAGAVVIEARGETCFRNRQADTLCKTLSEKRFPGKEKDDRVVNTDR